MKVLILINGAQEHRPFYAGVGDELRARGHEVHYAVDSHSTDVLHGTIKLPRAHYFSDYFKAHAERSHLPDRFKGTNVSRLFFPDADRSTHARGMKRSRRGYYDALVANLAWFFDDLFRAESFDCVVYECVSNSFAYFAYATARAYGARYLGFAQSRMPGRTDVYDRAPGRISAMEPTYRNIVEGRADVPEDAAREVREYIDNFLEKSPDYITHAHPFSASVLERYARARPLMRAAAAFAYRLFYPVDFEFAYQAASPYVAYPRQLAKEVHRHALVRYLYKTHYKSVFPAGERYFLYPIQFHPEASVSVDGPLFNDEWANVQLIAQSLPFGYRLYVKDHVHAAGRQGLEFYAKVSRLPNVRLITPLADTKRLIRDSCGVVCVTSTMGYEALIMGKPAFVLGDPFYDFFPAVRKVERPADLHELLSNHEAVVATSDEIRALVASYVLTSEKGRLELLEMYDDPATMRWVAGLVEKYAVRGSSRVDEVAVPAAV